MSETPEAPNRGRGRPAIHPWDQWLDGQARSLNPGVDWVTGASSSGIASQLRRKAKGRGLNLAVEVDSGGAIHLAPVVRA